MGYLNVYFIFSKYVEISLVLFLLYVSANTLLLEAPRNTSVGEQIGPNTWEAKEHLRKSVLERTYCNICAVVG